MSFRVLERRYVLRLFGNSGQLQTFAGELVAAEPTSDAPSRMTALPRSNAAAALVWSNVQPSGFAKEVCTALVSRGARVLAFGGMAAKHWASMTARLASQSEPFEVVEFEDGTMSSAGRRFEGLQPSLPERWIVVFQEGPTGEEELRDLASEVREAAIDRVVQTGRGSAGPVVVGEEVSIESDLPFEDASSSLTRQVFVPCQYRAHDRFADLEFWFSPAKTPGITLASALRLDDPLRLFCSEHVCSGFAELARERREVGCPINGVRAELLDVLHHEVDSTAYAYRHAARRALEEALDRAGTNPPPH